MDLELYFRVLWRFRFLVLAGLLLATALAFFAYARVSVKDGTVKVSYRQPVYYQSQATIFVTQSGFPWGRSVLPPQTTGRPGIYTSRYADPGRLSYLAAVYAQLATSDAVRARIRRDGPLRGKIEAFPGFDARNGSYQPYVYVAATATRPKRAIELANRAAATIRNVIQEQQRDADIPPSEQVELELFSQARTAKVVQPRKKTLSIVIFLSVLVITTALAFVLENIRPRVARLGHPPESDIAVERESQWPATASAAAGDRPAAARRGSRA